MGLISNSIRNSTNIEIQIIARRERIEGFWHESKVINELIDIDFLNDMHDLIYRRLFDIHEQTVVDGYLTMDKLTRYQKEVNLLEKRLQVINNLLTINTL